MKYIIITPETFKLMLHEAMIIGHEMGVNGDPEPSENEIYIDENTGDVDYPSTEVRH